MADKHLQPIIDGIRHMWRHSPLLLTGFLLGLFAFHAVVWFT